MRLNLESVSIAVGDRVLHHDLTLQVRGGESLAVMGPSGSGKSTLLAAIAGHWPVVDGSIEAIGEKGPAKVTWLVQSTPLLTRRSVWDNALLAARLSGAPPDLNDEATAVLARLGLEHLIDAPVRVISGGERQRVAVARAILARAELVLADEPTASLDAQSRELVIDALKDLVAHGAGLIVATHDPVVADACDTVLRLT